ncbi:shikimate kinase [Planomonospora venezuelensis]|uniref:Shikimate kinase n=1 Tax=Planomonospora venezuelensis TaxID=1999 RepID=A0A841D0Z5_PLAVE|nr:shikimate kinase [Planomonospora venezuelensis]GIN00045.1 shikimate kinase [Planomonospora venezuelensis]
MIPDRPIVVTGLMGSGKTSVARILAAGLGRELRDSDPDIAARYGGETAAQTVALEGKEALHRREAEHLRESLAERPAAVVAAAASVVDDPACRAALEPALVVWLDAPPAVLAERMRSGAHRPHFEPDLEAMLVKQRTRRGPLFAEVADLTFDVSLLTPEQVAAEVLERLGGR